MDNVVLNPAMTRWLDGSAAWKGIDWHNYAMRPVVGLIDNPFEAEQVPLTIDFRRGHVALFGASGWGKTVFIRTLLSSLTATHSPDELHAYILDLGGRNLTVLEHFPHVGAVIAADEPAYPERVEHLMRELQNIVEVRRVLLSQHGVDDIYQYNSRKGERPEAAILVAIDNFAEFVETFGSAKDNVESVLETFIALVRQARPFGVHFVITADNMNVLSYKLASLFTERLALRLTDSGDYRMILGVSAPEVEDLPGRGYISVQNRALAFQIALLTRQEEDERTGHDTPLIRQLAGLMTSNGRWHGSGPMNLGALPKLSSLIQLLAARHGLDRDETFYHQLKQVTAEQWRESMLPEKSDWLSVLLGAGAGSQPRRVRFEAAADGVHGMIAGGTGSGKSEVLITLIVEMALHYDPSILNFVLVDYKGGGAFKPFESLPHCVDSITNLNKAGVNRMFTAINAEIRRRQQLNADSGVKDIVDYRRKGYHLTRKPYPHLFIIIDEYAEMIADNRDFLAALESITRVGRSLGISLILASQKPVGVTDQMRANIKLRLCLRVEDMETSRELLRRSDAASLPSGLPGRGYLQVGNDNLELIQVAYSGESVSLPAPTNGEPSKFFNLAVRLAEELLVSRPPEQHPRCPWPPMLPDQKFKTLLLDSILNVDYVPSEAISEVALGQRPLEGPIRVNPFIKEWFEQTRSWPGLDWEKHAMRPVLGLVDNPAQASQIPLVLDLPRGHTILFGGSGMGKTTFLRTLLLSLASTHSPGELHIYVLDLGGRQLVQFKQLPHLGAIILPDDAGYEERVWQLMHELDQTIERRKRILSEVGAADLYQYNRRRSDDALPAIVVLIDAFIELRETIGGANSAAEEFFAELSSLLRQSRAYGIHFVVTAEQPSAFPNRLLNLFSNRIALKLPNSDDYRAALGEDVGADADIKGRAYVRIGQKLLACQIALPYSEASGNTAESEQDPSSLILAHLNAASWHGQGPRLIEALPTTSSYVELLKTVTDDDSLLTELTQYIEANWRASAQASEANWLQATLGVIAGNKARTLRFSALEDGVHGLVAGGTGAGKSELLATLIVDMALHYDPSILNFVLVDYKGGGAFKPFESLPHCVDSITNLNKAGVNRMFTAINAEIRRRQQLNADSGVKDIVDYRRKGYHLTREPYPHLFIIIDEYAEMIADNRDFLAALESITRVGRSLGISLILASQRPTGVTDQMQSNIKFRICLRVETADESRELLRRPDAAHLPSGMPGRGYLRVGYSELSLIQVAYTGEKHAEAQQDRDDEPRPFFELVIGLTKELARNEDLPPRRPCPWPGFLPPELSLRTSIPADYLADPVGAATVKSGHFTLNHQLAGWLNGARRSWPGPKWDAAYQPILGLIDNPHDACQQLLFLDLPRHHHVLFGGSGWGKTSFLRTLLITLAATYSPDHLHAYILDLGGRNFTRLSALPHVGDVIMPDDEAYEERVGRLLEKLQVLVEKRKELFGDANVADLLQYNRKHSEKPLAALLVLIDNFAELKENFNDLVDSTLVPLLRHARNYGVYFVVTAADPSAIPGRAYNLLTRRLTLTLPDRNRYLDIVGRGAGHFEEMPGRGLIKVARRPLIFQTALPWLLTEIQSEGQALQKLAAAMQRVKCVTTPPPIHVLPTSVSLQNQLAAFSPNEQRIEAIVGVDNDLRPAHIDLRQFGPHFAIVGPPLSGKTTALYNWILSLAFNYSPDRARFILIDLQQQFIRYDGKKELADLPHVLCAITDVDQLDALLVKLSAECHILATAKPGYRLFVFIENFDDFVEELEISRKTQLLTELATLVRRYGTHGLHFVLAGALDSHSQLKKRVLSSGYGIGLRDVDALTTLRAVTRNFKALPPGRGFIVRAGHLLKLQVAQPYYSEDTRSEELDGWLEQISEKHAGAPRATWSAAVETQEPILSHTIDAAVAATAGQQALAMLKRAVDRQSRAAGLSFEDLGISIDDLPPDDLLRIAEEFFA